jgi:hypothetical protein
MPEKQPGRGGPIEPLDLLKALPFGPRASSDGLGWVGLEAAHYREAPASELDRPANTHHILVLFARPPDELDLVYDVLPP